MFEAHRNFRRQSLMLMNKMSLIDSYLRLICKPKFLNWDPYYLKKEPRDMKNLLTLSF